MVAAGGIAAAVLFAPKGYWDLNPENKKRICNGCGAKGKFDFIPDTVWFLSIKEACNIHDYMYHFAKADIKAKEEADRVFLNNMLRLIEAKTKKRIGWNGISFKNPLLVLRRRRAYKYYLAVKHFGSSAFWEGKNEEGTLHRVNSYYEVKFANPNEKFFKLTPKH